MVSTKREKRVDLLIGKNYFLKKENKISKNVNDKGEKLKIKIKKQTEFASVLKMDS